jgi:hypothetical protein
MGPPRLADLFHHFRRRGGHLLHATVLVIRHQPLLAAPLKASPKPPYRPQGNPELDDNLMRVGPPLPTVKKSACEWESESHLA